MLMVLVGIVLKQMDFLVKKSSKLKKPMSQLHNQF